MKDILSILIIFPILLSADNFNSKHKINWLSWEEAVAKNEKQPKKIFVDLYTDWCGWCRKLDNTTFADSNIVKLMNEHYYAVKMNAETKDTIFYKGQVIVNPEPERKRSIHPLAMALLQGRASFPTVVFLDEKESIIQGIPGYLDAKGMYPVLAFFAQENYKELDYKTFEKDNQLY